MCDGLDVPECCEFTDELEPPLVNPSMLPFSAGRGLFLASTKAVVEDVGVTWPEPAGEMVLTTGDAVPDVESFFLESFFESFPRESCSC